jgi:hypothetical protein
MYSKTEVCFTVIVAIAAGWYFSSHRAADPPGLQGRVLSAHDGTHPPPPPWPTSAKAPGLDGTHPPPPPWLMSLKQGS